MIVMIGVLFFAVAVLFLCVLNLDNRIYDLESLRRQPLNKLSDPKAEAIEQIKSLMAEHGVTLDDLK